MTCRLTGCDTVNLVGSFAAVVAVLAPHAAIGAARSGMTRPQASRRANFVVTRIELPPEYAPPDKPPSGNPLGAPRSCGAAHRTCHADAVMATRVGWS